MGLENSQQPHEPKLGRSMLAYNRVITPEENVAELAKVTVADVQKLAQEMFQKDKLEITVLGTVTEITMQ